MPTFVIALLLQVHLVAAEPRVILTDFESDAAEVAATRDPRATTVTVPPFQKPTYHPEEDDGLEVHLVPLEAGREPAASAHTEPEYDAD